jgi:DHA1 family purine ribonucleoside efflux pump-like MFS transporter
LLESAADGLANESARLPGSIMPSSGSTPADVPVSQSENVAAPASLVTADWPAIASLTLGVFGLVTAEFLPASLLTAMSSGLGVSAGSAGQTVSATALVAAIAAPALPLLTRRLDRRHVMLWLTLLVLVANLLTATAHGLPSLLISRVILGVALGGFWSMSGALAMRLAPERLIARVMSVMLSGVSAATICAVPIGSWMGVHVGWRSAFAAAGLISLATVVAQFFTLPALAPRDEQSLRVLCRLLARPRVRVALLSALLTITGHFATFTYVRPVMENMAHLSPNLVSAVLFGYGIAALLGNFIGGRIAERNERLSILAGAGLMTVLAGCLLFMGSSALVMATAMVLWGLGFGTFPVGFQTWIVRAAPDNAEGAGGLLVCAFQIAIAGGALGGGFLIDAVGASGILAFAGTFISLGALLALSQASRGIACRRDERR